MARCPAVGRPRGERRPVKIQEERRSGDPASTTGSTAIPDGPSKQLAPPFPFLSHYVLAFVCSISCLFFCLSLIPVEIQMQGAGEHLKG